MHKMRLDFQVYKLSSLQILENAKHLPIYSYRSKHLEKSL